MIMPEGNVTVLKVGKALNVTYQPTTVNLPIALEEDNA